MGLGSRVSNPTESPRSRVPLFENAFDLIDEIFENFISYIFKEPHDFLIFTGSVTIYISLRSSQPKVLRKKIPADVFLIRRMSMLKITEMGFDILFKHFQGPFFAVFCCWEVISWIKNKKLFQNEHLIIQIMITMYG